MANFRSITQVGTSEPFELQVARGQIPGHKHVFKFGVNPIVQNVEETVWEGGGLYVYPSSAVTMTVSSASGATDNGVIITISGLDSDYNEQSETVTLAGSGTAITTKSFLRVNRGFVAGSQAPVGAITVANGGTTYAYINGDNQTLMSIWTVPAGYEGFITQLDVTVLTEQNNKFGNIRLVTREQGGVFRTQETFSVEQGPITLPYSIPIPIPEKTDIEYRAIASGIQADLRVSAAFEILYIKREDWTNGS
jgi:hypothetical protein